MKRPTDLFGRTAKEIRASIDWTERILKVRAGYSSVREGYGIRTADIVAGLEVDREQLRLVESGVDPKLPDENSLSGDALRRWRNSLLWVTRFWD